VSQSIDRPPPSGVAPGSPGSLVPPCPNLGPEPFDSLTIPSIWLALPAILILATVVLVSLRLLRGRLRGKTGKGPARQGQPPPDSSADVLIELSGRVRVALVERFGETWRAKTTEEISSDPALSEVFGRETAARLVAILSEADRLKFAAEETVETRPQSEDADDWAAFVSGFLAAAGARSMTTGK
jgi:hypothetical protein